MMIVRPEGGVQNAMIYPSRHGLRRRTDCQQCSICDYLATICSLKIRNGSVFFCPGLCVAVRRYTCTN